MSFFSHTMFTESILIADVLCGLGYQVDVIDFENHTFVPKERYDLLISTRKHFQRYAELVEGDCIKIAHLDTSHWMYNNSVAMSRCVEVQQKRKVSLRSYRHVEENRAIECADYGVLLGNSYSETTYSFSGKKIYQMPVPFVYSYPRPRKNHEAAQKNFLWFGSMGFVHKGLDLVLEAFAEMPEYRLVVCGPIEKDPAFEKAYYQELYERENIDTRGWIDVASDEFLRLANDSTALIYPSCAEGQSGGAVVCMHVGLIPVVSRQTGLDISPDYGLSLDELSVEEVKARVREIAGFPVSRLDEMSMNAWEYARRIHTRENYMDRYSGILLEILERSGRGAKADLIDTEGLSAQPNKKRGFKGIWNGNGGGVQPQGTPTRDGKGGLLTGGRLRWRMGKRFSSHPEG